MSQMLLINPKRRAKRSGAKRRKAPSAAQRANWARFAAMSRRKAAGSRARNPIKARARRKARVSRRRNPIMVYARKRRSTRRSNPVSSNMGGGLFNFRSYIAPLKEAAVMGAGAVAVDVAFGYINRYLPASMQKVSGSVGVGDAVKLVLTVALGKMLAGPTRGLSRKAAMGSLVVQARDITMTLLPPSITAPMNGLGFVNPARVVPQMGSRVNANMRANAGTGGANFNTVSGLGMYTGGTPLLSATRNGGMGVYTGGTPLLSRAPARAR